MQRSRTFYPALLPGQATQPISALTVGVKIVDAQGTEAKHKSRLELGQNLTPKSQRTGIRESNKQLLLLR